jgi:hypothetical protein
VIYTTWVLFLMIFFKQVMKVPTEEQIHSCYPKSIIDIWGNARTAMLYDCTEFRFQSPTDRVSTVSKCILWYGMCFDF